MALEKRFALRLAKSVDLTTRLVERSAGEVEVLAPRDWTSARIEAWLDLGGGDDPKAALLGIPAAYAGRLAKAAVAQGRLSKTEASVLAAELEAAILLGLYAPAATGAEPGSVLLDSASIEFSADLEAHLGARFRLSIDGADVPVTHAGTALAADNIRVDFAGETADRDIEAVTVDLDFFPGVHDDQEQQVNVRIDGVTRTVVFRPGSEAQTVSF